MTAPEAPTPPPAEPSPIDWDAVRAPFPGTPGEAPAEALHSATDKHVALEGLRNFVREKRINHNEHVVNRLERTQKFNEYLGGRVRAALNSDEPAPEPVRPQTTIARIRERHVEKAIYKTLSTKGRQDWERSVRGTSGKYAPIRTHLDRRHIVSTARKGHKDRILTGSEAREQILIAKKTVTYKQSAQEKSHKIYSGKAKHTLKKATHPFRSSRRVGKLVRHTQRLNKLLGAEKTPGDTRLDTPVPRDPVFEHMSELWAEPAPVMSPRVTTTPPSAPRIRVTGPTESTPITPPTTIRRPVRPPHRWAVVPPRPSHTEASAQTSSQEDWSAKTDPQAVLGLRERIVEKIRYVTSEMEKPLGKHGQAYELTDAAKNSLAKNVNQAMLADYLGVRLEDLKAGSANVPKDVVLGIIDELERLENVAEPQVEATTPSTDEGADKVPEPVITTSRPSKSEAGRSPEPVKVSPAVAARPATTEKLDEWDEYLEPENLDTLQTYLTEAYREAMKSKLDPIVARNDTLRGYFDVDDLSTIPRAVFNQAMDYVNRPAQKNK